MASLLAAIDEALRRFRPSFVVGGTVLAAAFLLALRRVLTTPWEELKQSVVGTILSGVKLAGGAALIESERAKMKASFRKELHKNLGKVYATIPEEGVPQDVVLKHLSDMKAQEDKKWSEGWVSGCVYLGEKEFSEYLNRVYCLYSSTNALHPDVWPSLRKMESEVVAMTAAMLRGGPTCCGCLTAGGTESLVMAIKTYRDWAAHEKGIRYPEMVVPLTAHAAVDKASAYLKIKVHYAPLKADMTVDVAAMEALVNSNTIMVMGSAPQYPHGVVDDIPAIGAVARRHKIGCHVDGCLGGFLLPWLRELGHPIPPFDFSVAGVTSMSADTHKYGYGQKGVSVILYATPELRRHQWFITVNWPGGVYASPSFAGSRPGGVIATTWAAMVAMGRKGYLEHAERIYQTAMKIRAGVAKIPGLFVYGSPPAMVVAWGSHELNVFAINDKMTHRGWGLNPIHRPAGAHVCVTNRTVGREDDLLRDLAECTEEVRQDPDAGKKGNAAIYGLAQSFPDRNTVADLTLGYLDVLMELAPEVPEVSEATK